MILLVALLAATKNLRRRAKTSRSMYCTFKKRSERKPHPKTTSSRKKRGVKTRVQMTASQWQRADQTILFLQGRLHIGPKGTLSVNQRIWAFQRAGWYISMRLLWSYDTPAVIFSQGFFANDCLVYNTCTEMSVMYSASGSCPSHNLCILSRQGRKGIFQSKYLYIVYMYFYCIFDSLWLF